MLFISEIAFIDFTLHEIKQCIVIYTLPIGHESSPFLLLSTQRFQSLKGHSSPETSAAYMKHLYEPTLKWPFVRLNCFYLPSYSILFC